MQEFIDGNHVPKGFTGKYRSKICGCVVERLDGEYHCSAGPAIVYDNGFKEFWYKGIKIDEEDYWKHVYQNEVLSQLVRQIPENFTGTFKQGDLIERYYKGKLHATAGKPAFEQSGQKKYYIAGIEVTEEQSKLFPLNTFIDQVQTLPFNFKITPFKNGWFVYNSCLYHAKNGKLHNDNGPAIINTGYELYYLNGEPITVNEFKKLKGITMSNVVVFKTLSEVPSNFTGTAKIDNDTCHFLNGELHRLGGEPAVINSIDPEKNEYWIQGIKVSKEFAPQIKELVTQEHKHFSTSGSKIDGILDGWFILKDTFKDYELKIAKKLCFFHTKGGILHNDDGFAAGGAYWGDKHYINGQFVEKQKFEALLKNRVKTFPSIEEVPKDFTGSCIVNDTKHHFLEGELHRIGGLPAIEGTEDYYIWGVKVGKEFSEVIKETDKPVKTITTSNGVYGHPDGWTVINNSAGKPIGLIHSKNGKLHHESTYAWTGKGCYVDEFYVLNQYFNKDSPEEFKLAVSKFKEAEAKMKKPEENILKVTNALSIPKDYTGKVQYPSGLTISYLDGQKHCIDGFAAKGNSKAEEYWLFGSKVEHPEIIKLINNKKLKTEVKTGETRNGWYFLKGSSDALLYKDDKIHSESGFARHSVYNKSSYYYLNGRLYYNKTDYDKELSKTVAKKKRVPLVNKYKLKAEKENLPFIEGRKSIPADTNGWVYHGAVKKRLVKGVLHNEDGPATIDYSTAAEHKGYYLENCAYSLDNFNKTIAVKKQALAEGALYFNNTSNIKIPEDYTGIVYIGKDWKQHYVNGFLHNESGYAAIHLERPSWSTYNFKGVGVSSLQEIETIKNLIKEADIVVYPKINEGCEEDDYDEEDEFEKKLEENPKFTGAIFSISDREMRHYVNGKHHNQSGMAIVRTYGINNGEYYLDGKSYTERTWKKKVATLPVKLTTLAASVIPKSIKGDIKEASNRVATRQFLNLIKTLIVAKLSGGNKTTEANLKVFFNTKKGFIMLNGLMATLLPALKPMIPEKFQPHLEILSKEYRVETMAMGGELIFDSTVETMVESFRANSEEVFEQLNSELSGQIRVDLSDNSEPETRETVEVPVQTDAPAYSVN